MATNRKRNSNHPVKKKVIKEPFSFKKLTAQKKKQYIILASALAVVLITLIALIAADMLPHLNGSLNVRGGEVKGVTKNDIVVNKGDNNDPEYFNLGQVAEAFEGYTIDSEYVIKTDDNAFERCFRPEDTDSNINLVYICGTKQTPEHFLSGITPTDMTAIDEETLVITSETTYHTSDNGNTFGGYFSTNLTPDSYNGDYHKYFAAYIPAKYDCSVLVHIISRVKNIDDYATDDEMIELAKQAADLVTIRK